MIQVPSLILIDEFEEQCKAWADEKVFQSAESPNVKIVKSLLKNCKLPFDCVMSAGNSYAIMDSDFDAEIYAKFGDKIVEKIRKEITNQWHGEQLVGSCIIVKTDDLKHPWIAHAPISRYNQDIRGLDHVYTSMWAMLNAVSRHNELVCSINPSAQIKTVMCPAIGTGFGMISDVECARQMALAYKNFCDNTRMAPTFDMDKCIKWQNELGVGGSQGFIRWWYDKFPLLEKYEKQLREEYKDKDFILK